MIKVSLVESHYKQVCQTDLNFGNAKVAIILEKFRLSDSP